MLGVNPPLADTTQPYHRRAESYSSSTHSVVAAAAAAVPSTTTRRRLSPPVAATKRLVPAGGQPPLRHGTATSPPTAKKQTWLPPASSAYSPTPSPPRAGITTTTTTNHNNNNDANSEGAGTAINRASVLFPTQLVPEAYVKTGAAGDHAAAPVTMATELPPAASKYNNAIHDNASHLLSLCEGDNANARRQAQQATAQYQTLEGLLFPPRAADTANNNNYNNSNTNRNSWQINEDFHPSATPIDLTTSAAVRGLPPSSLSTAHPTSESQHYATSLYDHRETFPLYSGGGGALTTTTSAGSSSSGGGGAAEAVLSLENAYKATTQQLDSMQRAYLLLHEHNQDLSSEFVKMRRLLDVLRSQIHHQVRQDVQKVRGELFQLKKYTELLLVGFHQDLTQINHVLLHELTLSAAAVAAAQTREAKQQQYNQAAGPMAVTSMASGFPSASRYQPGGWMGGIQPQYYHPPSADSNDIDERNTNSNEEGEQEEAQQAVVAAAQRHIRAQEAEEEEGDTLSSHTAEDHAERVRRGTAGAGRDDRPTSSEVGTAYHSDPADTSPTDTATVPTDTATAAVSASTYTQYSKAELFALVEQLRREDVLARGKRRVMEQAYATQLAELKEVYAAKMETLQNEIKLLSNKEIETDLFPPPKPSRAEGQQGRQEGHPSDPCSHIEHTNNDKERTDHTNATSKLVDSSLGPAVRCPPAAELLDTSPVMTAIEGDDDDDDDGSASDINGYYYYTHDDLARADGQWQHRQHARDTNLVSSSLDTTAITEHSGSVEGDAPRRSRPAGRRSPPHVSPSPAEIQRLYDIRKQEEAERDAALRGGGRGACGHRAPREAGNGHSDEGARVAGARRTPLQKSEDGRTKSRQALPTQGEMVVYVPKSADSPAAVLNHYVRPRDGPGSGSRPLAAAPAPHRSGDLNRPPVPSSQAVLSKGVWAERLLAERQKRTNW